MYIYHIFVYIYVHRAVYAGRACIVTECRDTKFSVLLKNLVGSSLKFPSVCCAVGQARWAYARPYSRVFLLCRHVSPNMVIITLSLCAMGFTKHAARVRCQHTRASVAKAKQQNLK